MVGGSGDLTPANNTQVKGQVAVSCANYAGRYIHYGAREHGMAGLMNGLALHGGFIPYGGSFLVFTDYARPAIRLAALMKKRVIYVMTHDSVALGEDGPTHQPIEHLASLRGIPGVRVFRPADAIEVGECWELALRYEDGPCRSGREGKGGSPMRLLAAGASEGAAGRRAAFLWACRSPRLVAHSAACSARPRRQPAVACGLLVFVLIYRIPSTDHCVADRPHHMTCKAASGGRIRGTMAGSAALRAGTTG